MKRLILAALLIATPVHAQMAGAGAGSLSCAHMGELYGREPSLIEDVVVSWAQGYLTGINAALIEDYRVMVDLTTVNRDVFAAVRLHCSTHPLDNVSSAIAGYATTLPAHEVPD